MSRSSNNDHLRCTTFVILNNYLMTSNLFEFAPLAVSDYIMVRFNTRLLLGLIVLFGLTPLAMSAEQARPNIVLVMADDMGYSDIGCYGSEIDTPNLDRLAANGLRFTQFYNAARCCPTRAALLTGLYPHQAGVGNMVASKPAKRPSATQGYLNQKCVTLAEVLKTAGYGCYMSGKWHVGEFRPAWPIDRGFDRYYGLISGGMNYFDISKGKRKGIQRVFARDGERLTPNEPDFYTTDAFTDEAIASLNHHAKQHEQRPFFLYLAFNAPHWPLHAPPKLIDKYRGRYLGGWDKLRRTRYERMVGMGLILPKWKLSPADGSDWQQLSEKQKAELDLRMAVYAAMLDRMDWDIGRVVERLRELNQLDNTLFLFLSDNGACHEGGLLGGDFRRDLKGKTGTADSYRTYGQSWSNAGNTPFRKHKHWTHEGGISTPLVIHWPGGLKVKPGSTSDHVGHVIDIMPTLLDVAGAKYPEQFNGRAVTPHVGLSFEPLFRTNALPSNRPLFWEHMGNAAMRSGPWKLVRSKGKPWELYNLEQDRSELHNIAATNEETVDQMKATWEQWARTVGAN